MRRLVNPLLIFSFILLVSISVTQAQMPGDVNEDSLVDVGDVVYEINYLFKHGAYPLCLDCADPNGSCNIEIGDVVYLINYLFKAGPEPLVPECEWSEPVNLGPVINSTAGQRMFRLSPDGSMAVWSSNRPGGYGNADIWCSIKDAVTGAWTTPHNCGDNINNSWDDNYPSLSPDNKKFYCLLYARPGGLGGWDVWVSSWDSLHNEWGPIESLGPPFDYYAGMHPYLSPDGAKLYFTIDYSIAYTEWSDTGWSEPIVLGPNVNANMFESSPTITADDKTLYFTRGRGSKDHWYICVSHWTDMDWSIAEELGYPVNDSNSSMHPYITPDGSKLFFSSGRPGCYGICDIWMSEKVPAKDKK
jgi:hypothetical protein